jgi:hypothetical protein
MRTFPLVAIAWACFCLASATVAAQQLHCNPCGHQFGKVQIGTSSSYSFQLSNTGNKTLKITAKSLHGSAFSMGSFPIPMKLQPGASVALTITFTPTLKGYAGGNVTLTSNDPQSPTELHFHGTGFYPTAAELTVSPSSLNFGSVTLGSTTTMQATLAASGAAVTISSDGSNSSEFAIVGLSLPATIQVGQNLAVTVQFTPNASGKASGKVGFTSNAVDSPTVIQVSGTGVAQGSHSVSLTWNTGDGNAVGYNVYRGTAQNGPFQQINTALDASTNYTDTTVSSGTTYYYVATEVNAQGQESGYSNEVMAVVPSP